MLGFKQVVMTFGLALACVHGEEHRNLRPHISDHIGDKDYTMVVVGIDQYVAPDTEVKLVFDAYDKSPIKGWIFRPKVNVLTMEGVNKLSDKCGGVTQTRGGFVMRADDDCFSNFKGDHKRDQHLFVDQESGDLDQHGVVGTRNYEYSAKTQSGADGFYFVVGWKERHVSKLSNVKFCLNDHCTEPETIMVPKKRSWIPGIGN